MKKHFRANGKFLLTGEYLVMHGALALALPLKLGQTLETNNTEQHTIHWTAYKPDGLWIEATLDAKTLNITSSNDNNKADNIRNILEKIKSEKPTLFDHGLSFKTTLDFDPSWGLGSSSTLIFNLSKWADIEPYTLLDKTFGGSGYDIACADASSPIFYMVENGSHIRKNAHFNPTFADNIYFIYQGKKQSSANEVKTFNKKDKSAIETFIPPINNISREIELCNNIDDFGRLIDEHEKIMAECLDKPRLNSIYNSFDGHLKSLGAWGGDFMMAATTRDLNYVRRYFERYHLNTIIPYNDIVLQQ